MKPSRVLILVIALLAAGIPVCGHHSLSAEFDPTKRITLNGVVTNVDWMNPHTHFYLDVKDSGKVRKWSCQLLSPNELVRRGVTRDRLKVGMSVTVVGTRAKDGSLKINTTTLSSNQSVLFAQ
jgi:hypothetical protein